VSVKLPEQGSIVVLSGAGLSAPSGIPTFRDADGLWASYRIEEVATPEGWYADRRLVRTFYDERRRDLARARPNPGHVALARLQQALGATRVVLVTQNIDGLLQAAGALEVIEMHGSLRLLRCERDQGHPHHEIGSDQEEHWLCPRCSAPLRPAVVWFGEVPLHMERIDQALGKCSLFLAVGTSGAVYPAAGFSLRARRAGAHCVEINPRPSGGPFHQEIAEGAEVALPRLVDGWLGHP
jgi:NAD-dependent deacetylase